jgi:hypothetical protein
MSTLIPGRQIPVASSIARRLEDLKEQVVKLHAEAERAGLHDDARELSSIREHLYEVADRLERKARNSYVAARRGEELPK